jgi:hypothetical protein
MPYNSCSIAVLAASLFVALHQDRIDLREPAAVGSVMVEKIGKAFGAKVFAGEGIAEIPLIFDVKGVTFEEFRSLSARGIDATWRQVRDGWELYRTPAQIKTEDDAFLAKRSALIRKEIATRTKEPSMAQADLDEFALKIKLASDDDLYELVWGNDVMADESLLFDVWTELGATHFAELPIDKRWVYTSDGRNGTKKLPVLEDLMRRIRHERERIIVALRSSGAWERLANSVGAFNADKMLHYLGLGDVKTLVLQVVSTQTSVALAVHGFDSSDRTCLDYYDSVTCDGAERSMLSDTIEDAEVAFCPESLSLHAAFKKMFEREEGDAAAATSDNLEPYIQILTRLDERDILSYDVSDVLFTAAAKSGKPLFGRLTNDMVYASPFFQFGSEEDPRIDKLKLRAGLSWLDGYLQIDSEGSLQVTPELPAKYQSYFPRKAMVEYVKANRGKPIVDITRISAVMAPPASLDAEELGEIALIVHRQYESLWETDFSILSSWADMTQQQKLQAASPGGVSIPLSRCGKKLQYDIAYSAINYGQWSMVYGSLEGEEETHHDFETGDEPESLKDWLLYDVDASTLKNLVINFRTTRGLAVHVYREEYGDEPVNVTASELADWVFELESDPEYKEELQNLLGAKFGIEEQLTIEMRYQSPVGTMRAVTSVQTSAGNRSDYSFSQLPASFLNEYRRALDVLRKGG